MALILIFSAVNCLFFLGAAFVAYTFKQQADEAEKALRGSRQTVAMLEKMRDDGWEVVCIASPFRQGWYLSAELHSVNGVRTRISALYATSLVDGVLKLQEKMDLRK